MNDRVAARRAFGATARLPVSRRLISRAFLAPVFVCVVGLASTALLCVQYDAISAERDALRFSSLVEQRIASIDERMRFNIGLLRGVAAHFAAADSVDRASFAALVRRLRLAEDYPGVQGVGFIRVIAPGEEAAVEASLRAQGQDEFRVWPAMDGDTAGADQEAPLSTAIVYLEPEDARNREAIGFDMASEAKRRDAMIRARDRGRSAASGRVVLIGEDVGDPRPGFLIYTPVFADGGVPESLEARRQSLEGFVYAPFGATNLFTRAPAAGAGAELDFTVYDGDVPDPEEAFYATAETGRAGRLGFRAVETVTIADRAWTVAFETTPYFERSSPRVFTPYIALAGLFVTGLITAGSVRQARAVSVAQAAKADLEDLNHTLEDRVDRRTAQLERARARLAELNVDLERAVQARTAELTVANEEIQRFAHIVSHDLRSPLVNVMGFTSELETVRADLSAFLAELGATAPDLARADILEAVETDLPEALGFIKASTQKMDRLINAILRLSREGRRVLSPERVDMNALVGSLHSSLAHQIEERGAVLDVGPLPELVSDRLALEQVFGNLVENAVKYLSPDRPGRVTISAQESGMQVRFAISDNGRGIAPTDFERIFDLFRRAGPQDVQGEGIGLAHTRALVRRLGGAIIVDSTQGEGSTFTVTLPKVFETARPGAARTDEREEAA